MQLLRTRLFLGNISRTLVILRNGGGGHKSYGNINFQLKLFYDKSDVSINNELIDHQLPKKSQSVIAPFKQETYTNINNRAFTLRC